MAERRPVARREFTYSRSVQHDVADVMASVRHRVPTQLWVVDLIVRELADAFGEHDPSFDVESFATRCKFWHNRATNQEGDEQEHG